MDKQVGLQDFKTFKCPSINVHLVDVSMLLSHTLQQLNITEANTCTEQNTCCLCNFK